MMSELESNIKKLRNNKTPGRDKIENQTIKILANTLTPVLTNIFNEIVESRQIPKLMEISKT